VSVIGEHLLYLAAIKLKSALCEFLPKAARLLLPIAAIRSCLNLEGYSVGVVLRFVGFGPPVIFDFIPNFWALHSAAIVATNYLRLKCFWT